MSQNIGFFKSRFWRTIKKNNLLPNFHSRDVSSPNNILEKT